MKGKIMKASRILGVSHPTISIVLSGKRENVDLLIRLKMFVEHEENEQEELYKQFIKK